MKRSWLWFIASAVLAVLAAIVAIVLINRIITQQGTETAPLQRHVVVALQPLAAGTVIGPDNVALEPRSEEEIPSGVILKKQDVLGMKTREPLVQGEIITVQHLVPEIEPGEIGDYLGDDKIAVTMPADALLTKLGAVVPGDHIDLLFTLDIILETPMYPQEVLATEEGLEIIERDQSLDQASVLALQNLEVLQILEEPQPEVPVQQQEGEVPEPPLRALVLKIDPQDATILKYLIDSEAKIDVALRSPTNATLFDVDSVNINYLVLRYGIPLPEPLE